MDYLEKAYWPADDFSYSSTWQDNATSDTCLPEPTNTGTGGSAGKHEPMHPGTGDSGGNLVGLLAGAAALGLGIVLSRMIAKAFKQPVL